MGKEIKDILAELSKQYEVDGKISKQTLAKFLQLEKEFSSVQVVDYLDEFMVALKEQLLSDAERWGDAWLDKEDVEGQEDGFLGRVTDYLKEYRNEKVRHPLSLPCPPMPWLKIAGYALICWIRENHPEILLDMEKRGGR